MVIKIMTSRAIAYAKKNIEALVPLYEKGEDPEKFYKEKMGEQAFIPVNFEVPDFELMIEEAKPSSYDIMSAKTFYTHLIDINPTFASDERLWAGLAHTIFYEYMKKRLAKEKCSAKGILDHYFFNDSMPRCYMINTLSRLWWLGKLTYFEDDMEPFKALDYMGHDINGYAFPLFGSNWSNDARSLHLFFDGCYAYEKESEKSVDRNLFIDTIKHMNALCGIYNMDLCSDHFIISNIKSFLFERCEETEKQKEEDRLNNVRSTGTAKLDNVIKAINFLGGTGTQSDIIAAHGSITEQIPSQAVKDYIKTSLNNEQLNIFYKIRVDGNYVWKISNDYLIVGNVKKRKDLVAHQISSMSSDTRTAFNIITAFKATATFTVDEFLSYGQQIKSVRPDIDNVNKYLKEQLKEIAELGLIEYRGNNTYKKASVIKE